MAGKIYFNHFKIAIVNRRRDVERYWNISAHILLATATQVASRRVNFHSHFSVDDAAQLEIFLCSCRNCRLRKEENLLSSRMNQLNFFSCRFFYHF